MDPKSLKFHVYLVTPWNSFISKTMVSITHPGFHDVKIVSVLLQVSRPDIWYDTLSYQAYHGSVD